MISRACYTLTAICWHHMLIVVVCVCLKPDTFSLSLHTPPSSLSLLLSSLVSIALTLSSAFDDLQITLTPWQSSCITVCICAPVSVCVCACKTRCVYVYVAVAALERERGESTVYDDEDGMKTS